MKALVKIVMDQNENRLRVIPINGSGWVRFPRHLRIEGATYECELKASKSGSWIAVGDIKKVA